MRAVRVGRGEFVFDEAAAKREAEAEARRKVERRRQEYEARMTRKAKREGKPVDTYLRGLRRRARPMAAAKAMEGRPRMEGGALLASTASRSTQRAAARARRAAPSSTPRQAPTPTGCRRRRRWRARGGGGAGVPSPMAAAAEEKPPASIRWAAPRGCGTARGGWSLLKNWSGSSVLVSHVPDELVGLVDSILIALSPFGMRATSCSGPKSISSAPSWQTIAPSTTSASLRTTPCSPSAAYL